MAVLCMRNASGHYRNSSFILDVRGTDTTFHRTHFIVTMKYEITNNFSALWNADAV